MSGLTVDTLVLGILVGVVEVAQDLDETEMRSCIVNDSLGAVLDQVSVEAGRAASARQSRR